MSDRQDVVVEHDFDWDRVTGAPLKGAAEYLANLATKLPPDAFIDENWLDFSTMKVRVISFRKENDEEYNARIARESLKRDLYKKSEEQRKSKAERLEEYNRLKREFG